MNQKIFDPSQIHGPSGQTIELEEEVEVLANRVIGAAIEVHKALGPGFPESVYEKALSIELKRNDIPHETQVPIRVQYCGETVGEGRADLIVGRRLLLELKAVESLAEVHTGQVVSYLSATRLRLGLLINFNVSRLQKGIKRIVK